MTSSHLIPTHGTLNYVPRDIHPAPPSHHYHLPPLSTFTSLSLPLTSLRPLPSLSTLSKSPYQLSTHGFTALDAPTSLHLPPYTNPPHDPPSSKQYEVSNQQSNQSPFSSKKLIKEIYIPETESLLLKITGGRKVWTEHVIVRNNVHSEVDGLAAEQHCSSAVGDEGQRGKEREVEWPKFIGFEGQQEGGKNGASPAPKVHLDFSARGAKQHIASYHTTSTSLARSEGIISALEACSIPDATNKRYEGPRWALFSIWRPLKMVRRDALGVSFWESIPPTDHQEIDLLFPSIGTRDENGKEEEHREGSLLGVVPEEGRRHVWYWIPSQLPTEVLILRLYDSAAEEEYSSPDLPRKDHEKGWSGWSGGALHSSINLPGTEHEEARESIEVRCVVVW